MEVWALFEISLDGDGYRVYNLLKIVRNVDKATEIMEELVEEHLQTTGEPAYTHIGTRFDLPAGPVDKIEECGYLLELFTITD